eukprot:Clim_evm16s205 gene=Clim_evmTU16s205
MVDFIVDAQVPLAAALKPAWWSPFAAKVNQYSDSLELPSSFQDRASATQFIADKVKGMEGKPTGHGFMIRLGKVDTASGDVEVHCISSKARWLDVCQIHVEPNEGQNGVLVVAKSGSTGIVPLAVPLAPLLNILLFWAPFLDHGMNKRHIKAIQANISKL